MFWISFHCFRPGLFLGIANRMQLPPLSMIDSRVIVTFGSRAGCICQFKCVASYSFLEYEEEKRHVLVFVIVFLFRLFL